MLIVVVVFDNSIRKLKLSRIVCDNIESFQINILLPRPDPHVRGLDTD